MVYTKNMKKDRILVSCQKCEKTFETRPYLVKIGKGKYCSSNCYWEAKVGSTRESKKTKKFSCIICGKVFCRYFAHLKKSRLGEYYCSRKCVGKANGKRLNGSGHWNWKGGISPRSLNTVEYKEWRRKVFERDGFKCVWCGYDKGRILEADHIKPWSKFPELRFDINNGRTLCKPCHMKTDTWGVKKNSNTC